MLIGILRNPQTCFLRGKLWQAEYMVSAVRDHTLALACIRLGLPPAHARGTDSLPESVTRPLLGSLVGSLNAEELSRALAVVVEGLTNEIIHVDPALANRISAELRALFASPEA